MNKTTINPTRTRQRHSPGPWRVDGRKIWIDGDRHHIAATEADALIIGAAPDLLRAIDALTHLWDHHLITPPLHEKFRSVYLQVVVPAIIKAEPLTDADP
jgi:hypothetical protein